MRRRFQSFVINGGKVRQPGQGDATFGGKYYVVLARSEAPTGDIYVFLDVMEDGPTTSRRCSSRCSKPPMQTGQVQVLDMAAMQKSLAESGRVAIYGVYFDTDKAVVKPESKAALDEMGKLLNANPNLKVYVVGHTDNQGTLAGNMDLSQSAPTPWSRRWRRATRSRPRACRRAAWRRWRRWPPTTPRPAARRTAASSWSASDDTPPRHGLVIKSPGTARFRGFCS